MVKWGVLMMAFQDGLVLWLMYGLHMGDGAIPLSTVPRAALTATLVALAFNLPRRLAHFLLASCEAAYREKEELVDDARVYMFATTKMANKESIRAAAEPAPPAAPIASAPPANAKAAGAKGPKPTPKGGKAGGKPMSFREQLKAGSKAHGKSMY